MRLCSQRFQRTNRSHRCYDQETDIRVYKGELESFTASESQGVGIRVVKMDVREWLMPVLLIWKSSRKPFEARDNATFGTFDEMLQIAEPDNVEPISLDLYNPALKEFATEDKIALAKELEEYIMKSDERIVGWNHQNMSTPFQQAQ